MIIKELDQENLKIHFKPNENKEIIPRAVHIFKDTKETIENNAIATESKGTLKLIDLIETIAYSLETGKTVMIDELDASIHHEIIMNIILAYGNPEINKHGAQLIFTTHNPVYMDEKLLRRDEIIFVEKNKNTSFITSLEDYDVRKDTKYLKNYLNGNLTILPNFDISEILDEKNS